jgi:alpha-galactosidase
MPNWKTAVAALSLLIGSFLQIARADDNIDRSSIVSPDEMKASQSWLADRIASFTDANSDAAEPVVKCIKQGWGTFHRGWSVNDNPLKLNGMEYTSGFGSHADSVITITLPDGEAGLSGFCGIDDTPEARQAGNPVTFTITLDGKQVFTTKPLRATDNPANFNVEVHGAKIVTLTATLTSEHGEYTPVDWTQLELVDSSGHMQILAQRHAFQQGVGELFNFTYDGKPASQALAVWPMQEKNLTPTTDTTGQEFSWTDPKTGLQCTLDIKRYLKYPIVEWVQHFKNAGSADTPILQDIHPMDVHFPTGADLVLHHNTGDYAATDSYQPFDTPLAPSDALHFAPNGGRPTDHAWPYFNIERPDKSQGMILAIGWPGQWSADISRDDEGVLHVSGGQELTHLKLHPGEEIRTPLCVAMFYRGDAMRAQNIWRRWMLDCNVPRPGGKLPAPIHAVCMGLHDDEKMELDGIHRYVSNGADLTHWWMDAGWYPTPEDSWWPVGTWSADPKRFPNGLRTVSDLAHANGLKYILWFEPERVYKGSWLDQNHPEWLLHNPDFPHNYLLDLGNPTAWNWLLKHIDDQITNDGIDVFRQDFNFEPLGFWRGADAPDRQGMTEMRHVEGLLAFWDELRRRHPNLLIDTCASGGRRLDLETLRRAISLWSSDDSGVALDTQSHTYGLASWVPYYGTGVGADNAYLIRSCMLPIMQLGDPSTGTMDWDLYRREIAHWKILSDDQLGDFYPLLPYSLSTHDWMAWQFDRPDKGVGAVQVFRREDSPYTEAKFPLHNLDPAAIYTISNVDEPDHVLKMTGADMCGGGLKVRLNARPGAAIIFYAEQKP